MKFSEPLIEGTLLRRQTRFLADVKLKNGEEVTVHCATPGSLQGFAEPGSKVLLSAQQNPKLKLKHQLEIIYSGKTPIAVHTGRPGTVVAEAIVQGRIAEVAGYAQLKRDVTYGKNNRVDILLSGNGLRPCYIEAKNVTFAYQGVAYYPDVISENEAEHLSDLVDLVREGNRAMLIFVAPRSDVNWFRPADHIDAEYGLAFRDAIARGVEVLAYRALVTKKGIDLEGKLPLDLATAS